MIKQFCDRCKKEITGGYLYTITFKVDPSFMSFINSKVIEVQGSKYDMCPKCASDFINKFMNEGGEHYDN